MPSHATAPRFENPRPSFLFLRRFAGERIVVFDQDAEVWIKVSGIDLPGQSASVEVTGLKPLKLYVHDSVPFLQGAARLKLHTVQKHEDGPYVSLGVYAPRSMLIRREELIIGTTREFRIGMARG